MRQPWDFPQDDPDIARFAAMSSAERIELCLQLCDVTDSIVNARPDRDRLRAAAPLSEESEALMRRLIAEHRRER